MAGKFASLFVKDHFRNLESIQKVRWPTLLIHGKEDDLCPYEHSVRLKKSCLGFSKLHLGEGMTHNSFLCLEHIVQPLEAFLKILEIDLLQSGSENMRQPKLPSYCTQKLTGRYLARVSSFRKWVASVSRKYVDVK